MMFSASFLSGNMNTELDQFSAVIETLGMNLAAVKYALRMRKYHWNKGDLDGATEWHLFAVAILRRIRKSDWGVAGDETIH